MKKSYKYRIYPNKIQTDAIDKNIAFCCFLYNCALQEKISYYKKYNKGLNRFDQEKELKELKKDKNFKSQTKGSE